MRLAPLSGIAAAILLLAGLSENNVPSRADDATITAWLGAGHTGSWLAHGALIVAAGIALLLFVYSVRGRLVADQSGPGPSLVSATGTLFATTVLVGGAAFAALPIGHVFEHSPTPSPDTYRLSMATSASLMVVFAMVPAAAFAATTATVGLRRRTIPVWLAVASYVFAVLMLASALIVPFMVFGLWAVITSITLTVTRPVPTSGPVPALTPLEHQPAHE